MEYIKATEKDLEQIVILVQKTIKTIYPKYYPEEVVEFFCEHHCKENIFKDIEEGLVGVCHSVPELLKNGKIKLSEKWQWLNGDKSEGSSYD